MQFSATTIGHFIETYILSAAALLKIDGMPGIIALVLVFALVVFGLAFWRQMNLRRKVVAEIKEMVLKYEDIPAFSAGFEDFRGDVKSKAQRLKNWLAVSDALDEYQETLVREDNNGTVTIRNAVRPSSFLNIDDLGFGPGSFRILPSIFVSLGLFFTFLGLVGALDGLGTDMAAGGSSQTAVIGLMKIASAKFVTSLTGLGCSIIFSVLMRKQVVLLDKDVHKLCLSIERRISFVSLEDIGFRQLKAMEESRDQFRTVGMEMVADLGRKLDATAQDQREHFHRFGQELVTSLGEDLNRELPRAIGDTIRDQTQPLFDKIGNIGASGMGEIVGGLSDQITGSVQSALSEASDALVSASDRISDMSDRMDASTGKMGHGMETALEQMASAIADLQSEITASGRAASDAMNEGAEKLLSVMNSTLEGIRDNTKEGADAMSLAAAEMRKSAEGFKETLESAAKDGSAAVQGRMDETSERASEAIASAGSDMIEKFGETSQKIADLGEQLGSTVTNELTGKIEGIGSHLSDVASHIARGAGEMQNVSAGLQHGAESIQSAASRFDGASEQLVSATNPIRSSHERIEVSVKQLANSTEAAATTVTAASERIASSAAETLDAARVALGQEREGIVASLEATKVALEELKEQSATLEDVDEKLGKALQHYASTFQASLGSAEEHIRSMQKILEPGIDTLRSVVEQAESFVPEARRA